MVEGLVTTDENNNYIAVLAREIPTEENGLIERRTDGLLDMTWRLRDGVRWHDGVPVTARDIKWSLERAADPLTNAPVVDTYLGDIVGVSEVLEGSTTDISGIRS